MAKSLFHFIAGIGIILKKTLVPALLLALPVTANILMLHIHYFTIDGLVIGLIMFGSNIYLLFYYRNNLKNLFE